MKKQQKTSIIMVTVGLLLIILGIFYYKNKAEVPEDIIPEETDTSLLPAEENAQNKADLANSEEFKAQEAIKKAKWNTAMTNARTAFGKGEYDKSIGYYNEALSYYKTDTVYSGLFVVYSAQNNIDKARIAIDNAIKLNPFVAEYWNSKLIFLDEKTSVSFIDLKRIYEEGLPKVDPQTKINLVTHFAGIAERNWQKAEAIALWEYAKQLYPQNSSIYQAEIDRLNK
ncbi:MAG: hypothetical protein WC870_00310 [Candidatus Paceibacterota bacterium]